MGGCVVLTVQCCQDVLVIWALAMLIVEMVELPSLSESKCPILTLNAEFQSANHEVVLCQFSSGWVGLAFIHSVLPLAQLS